MRTEQDLLKLRKLVASTPPRSASNVAVGSSQDSGEDGSVVLGTIPSFPIDALPAQAQPMVNDSPLPKNMLANSVTAAIMTAIGGEAEIQATNHWVERCHEFFANLAPTNTAKSPALRRAFEEIEKENGALRKKFEVDLADWRKLPTADRQLLPRPVDDSFLRSRATPQAASRQLYRQPSTAFVVDELSILLRSVEHPAADGRGSDQGYYLEMWDGAVLRLELVSGSQTVDNGIDIVVERPSAVLIGGLQTSLHELLGSDEEGLRARWMLSLDTVAPLLPLTDSSKAVDTPYADLIAMLFKRRTIRRRWVMSDPVRRVFDELRAGWREGALMADLPPSMSGFLGKADRHALRIAIVHAESQCGGDLPTDNQDRMHLALPLGALESAARHVDFSAACWGALSSGTFSVTLRDKQLDLVIDRSLIPYLERKGEVTSHLLRKNNVGGISSRADLGEVLARYKSRFPRGVEDSGAPPGGGPPSTIVRPPERAQLWTGYVRARDARAHDLSPRNGVAEADSFSEAASAAAEAHPTNEQIDPVYPTNDPVYPTNDPVYPTNDPVYPTNDGRSSGENGRSSGENGRSSGKNGRSSGPENAPLEQESFVEAVPKPTRKAAPKRKTAAFEDYPTPAYTLVTDPAALEQFGAYIIGAVGIVGLDVETTALHIPDGRLRLIQVAHDDRVTMLDADRLDAEAIARALGPLLAAEAGPALALHNAAFDLKWLEAAGLPRHNASRIFDTQVAAYLLEARGSAPRDPDSEKKNAPARKYGLKDLAERYLQLTLPKGMQASGWDAAELDVEQLDYASRDPHATAELARQLSGQLERRELLATMAFEMATLPAMVELHSSGVEVDREAWARQAAEVSSRADRLLLDELIAPYGPRDVAGAQQRAFWRSRTKKLAVLNELGIPAKETNENHLLGVRHGHPLVPKLIAWQKLEHTARTYGDSYLTRHVASDGRLYPGWRLLGSDVGRMSCLEPNLQNLPHALDYRKLLRAPVGRCFVRADYAALHPRIIAHLAPEPVLLALFRNPDADAYRHLAAQIQRLDDESLITRSQRQTGKLVFLGFMYGAKAPRFVSEVRASEGIEYSLQEALHFREAFLNAYPGIRAWHARFDWSTPATIVDVHTGRRRERVTSANEKINTPVLMIESAGVKQAMQDLMHTHDRVPNARLVAVIHDEFIVETDVADAERTVAWVRDCMQSAMQALIPNVPVVVETTICRDYAGTPLEEVPPMA